MSLLTQFYPGPGGGGGSSGGVTSIGFPSVTFRGVQSNPSIVGTATTNSGTVVSNVSGGNPFWINQSPTSGAFKDVTVTNCYISGVMPTANLSRFKAIYLDNGQLGSLTSSTSFPNFTGVYGSGSISASASFNAAGQSWPSFTTISTDIQIIPNSPTTFVLNDCALDAATVNHILVSILENGGEDCTLGTRTVTIQSGTSAGAGSLTAAGTAAVTALTAAGWTINLNP